MADEMMAAQEKTFTQEEVNRIVSDRLKREANTLESFKAQMAAEAAAQAEAKAMQERFTAAMGDKRKAIHPRLEALMIEDFSQAVNDPVNAGKDDGEIFSALFVKGGYVVPKDFPRFTTPTLHRAPSVSSDPIADAFKKG